MDPAPDAEPASSPVVESEGLEAPVAQKRASESARDGAPMKKKARGGPSSVDCTRRVAEIVLVLSAMVEMRGGRRPTDAEVKMMAEARAKVAELCGGLAPKDIVPRDAIGVVMEDLGLNKVRDQRLGFRPPKMSIAEKISFTKRKMEESKVVAANSASYSSQRPRVTENPGSLNNVRMFTSDKQNHPSALSGGIQPASSIIQVPAVASTPMPCPYPSNGVRQSMVSCGLSRSQTNKDSIPSVLPKVERPHFRSDGGLNGTSYASQAGGSNDHPPVKTPMWSLQSQSAPLPKSGSQNKVLVYPSAKVEATADKDVSKVSSQVSKDQTSKTIFTQAMSGSLPPQPFENANYGQASSLYNVHREISKLVQNLLQPQVPQNLTWTPPSREYMNKALTCQACEQTINEVETALVCDACENGFHLKCILSANQKGILIVEWHCPRCLALSNGKPLPPKYGRVMRNFTAPKMHVNNFGAQPSPEKRAMTSQEQKARNSGEPGTLTPNVGSNFNELPPDVKIENATEMQVDGLLSNKQETDDNPTSKSGVSTADERLVQPTFASEASSHEQIADRDLQLESPVKLLTMPIDTNDNFQAAFDLQNIDQKRFSDEVLEKPFHDDSQIRLVDDVPSVQLLDNNLRDKDVDGSDAVQESHVPVTETGFDNRERGDFLADRLCIVDWTGGIDRVVDGKAFYQSCFINGVMYKVQDHGLFRSCNGRLTPSELQAMWEDSKTSSKWISISQCYFPDNLPEDVNKPCTPESNEIYKSNLVNTVMADLLQGPCEVLPPDKYMEELERRAHSGVEATVGLHPVFQCRWVYDEFNRLFQHISS